MLTVESQLAFSEARFFVVMGVAGCGKTSVGTAIAQELEAKFLEGDQFHPASNISKMSQGIPLTDEDRWPWLERIGTEMKTIPGKVFVGCSALKRSYRDHIRNAVAEPVGFIFLDGPKDLIANRMKLRSGHFMPLSLLESQFETLEKPEPDELFISISITESLESICKRILEYF